MPTLNKFAGVVAGAVLVFVARGLSCLQRHCNVMQAMVGDDAHPGVQSGRNGRSDVQLVFWFLHGICATFIGNDTNAIHTDLSKPAV